MNDPTPIDDPLERELADLQPAELSDGVRRGVATALAPPSSQQVWRPSLVLRIAAAGVAIAACIAVAVVVVRERTKLIEVAVGPTSLPADVDPSSPSPAPTLGELRLALARSPEAAEALLIAGARAPATAHAPPPRAFGPVVSGAWPAGPSY